MRPTTLLLAATVLVAACRDQPRADEATPAPVKETATPNEAPPTGARKLREIRFEDLTAAEEQPQDLGKAAKTAFERELGAERNFGALDDADPTACVAGIEVYYALRSNGKVVRDADKGVAAIAANGAVTCPVGPAKKGGGETEGFRVELVQEAEFGGETGKDWHGTLKALLDKLARRTADALYGQVAVRHLDDARILSILKDSDHAGMLMEAAAEAGERKLEAAVPDLVRLTRHDEPMVGLRAGAALGLLKAKGHDVVRALAEMTKGQDLERHLVAVNALGDIGGAEAVRYLDTIAVGHPEPAIRELAREAIKRARGAGDSGAEGSDREGAGFGAPGR